MKRTFIRFGSMLLLLVTVTACEKAEIPAPAPLSESSMKKTSGGNGGQTAGTTYSGRATGVDATVWDFQNAIVTSTQTTFADTYFLPATGGSVTKSEVQATIANVLTTGALSASATGQNNSLVSQASATSVTITVGGNTITADHLSASASNACGAVPAGTVQITNLVVNGNPVVVTGAASQAIYLPNGGMLILNERSGSKKGSSYTMTVTALHLILPNVADIKVASAKADIKC